MGMRVGGSGAAMGAWKAQQSAPAPAASSAPAAAAGDAAGKEISSAMAALATGTTTSKMA